jgi:hypothetical protein
MIPGDRGGERTTKREDLLLALWGAGAVTVLIAVAWLVGPK